MARKNKKVFGSFESEELRNASKTLYANIRFASLEEETKVIGVTSTIMDEGKSTVASNLACAIASSGKRVLIIDADMRRRSLGSMLGVHGNHGIYAVLSGKVPAEQAIVRTQYQNLYFLDCEPNIPNPSDILSSKRFVSLINALGESFGYVIIDTPPVSLFADAAIVGTVVDGMILCVREHHARRDDVINSAKQLRAANARVLGTVMTFVAESESDYYYSSYYNEENKRSRKRKGKASAAPVTPKEFGEASLVRHASVAGASKKNPYAPGSFKKAGK